MKRNHGAALIETLIAAIILVSGLVAVASIFSVTTNISLRNRQRTTATLLLSDKMEHLRTTATPTGGSLDPMNPMPGFMDYVRLDSDGTISSSSSDPGRTYLRLWQVEDIENPTVTVAIFARTGATPALELARATGPY